MAEVSGAAAYQRLQVPKDNISQALQFWGSKLGDQAAKRKADKAAADKAAREKASKERTEAFAGLPEIDIKATMLGQKTPDDVNRNFAVMGINRATDFTNKAKAAWDAGDKQGFNDYNIKAKRVIDGFKQYNELITVKSEVNKDFYENSNDYNGFDSNTFLNEAPIKNNVMPYFTEDGEMRIIMGVDLNKDGELTDQERTRANDYIREGMEEGELELVDMSAYDFGNQMYKPFKKVDIVGDGGMLDELAASTGLATRNQQSGKYFVNETVGFDDTKYDKLRNNVAGALADPQTLAWAINTMPKDEFDVKYKDEKGNFKIKKVKGDTSKVRGFTKEEEENAIDFYTQQTIAKYKNEQTTSYLAGRESADVRRQELAKKREEKTATASQLRYDTDQFMKGDYTGLIGRVTINGDEYDIAKVVPSPDETFVVALTREGKKIAEVPKTERGFLEFKIRGNKAYKNLTPGKIMSADPIVYREGEIKGSDISAVANNLFNTEGERKGSDEEVLERLNETFGIEGVDDFDFDRDIIIINGVEINTSNKKKFKEGLNRALNKKEQVSKEPAKKREQASKELTKSGRNRKSVLN